MSDIHIVPIRHHSPACARHLRAMIAEVCPAAILVEGPEDYDPLIPLIADAATRPPIAIVSIFSGEARGASYYPLCTHSPEYVALTEAAARGVPARFIDLPADDTAMRADPGDADDAQATAAALIAARDESLFDSGDYVRALAERLGCRDGNEVWDHLFEARIGEADWRSFFADVGRYCGHIRDSTTQAQMQADGTLAREARMIAHLADARRSVTGPILVLVGGFHAPPIAAALADLAAVPGPKRSTPARPPYLIRYGYRQLNALTGYGAGLPLPAYYDRLWREAEAAPDGAFDRTAQALLLGFATHLKTALPGVAVPVPVLVATLESAHRLAALRGRPGPSRDDILDACRSTLLKGEEGGDASPVMAELSAFLTGSAIGDVPRSAGSPPLVEAVRARARSLGFRVDDGERRNRELDIYRKPRHRAASRFLHATVFLDSGFATRTGGPDFRSGVDLDRLIEHWSLMWSPLFEARLIERAVDGDTIEEALAAELDRRVRRLADAGQAGNAVAAIDLFAAACQAGIADRAAAVLPLIQDDITRDADIASVAAGLRDLVALWRGRAALGFDDDQILPELVSGRGTARQSRVVEGPAGRWKPLHHPSDGPPPRDKLGEEFGSPIASLIGTAWRRALFLLPGLAQAGEDRIPATLDAMGVLREVVMLAGDDLPMIDPAAFDEAIMALLDAPLDPALAGAMAALAFLAGRIDEAEVAARFSGELRGAHPDPARRIGWLRGLIAISRELLWRVPALIDSADAILSALDDEDFLGLLPHLRIAFSQLDPREVDRLAHAVAGRHGGDAAMLVARHDLSEAEVHANRAADRAVRALLEADGLA